MDRGTPKWMVYNGSNPIKTDDLGGPPLFLETPKCSTFRTFLGGKVFKRIRHPTLVARRQEITEIQNTKICIRSWNPNDPCFDWKRPCFGGVDLQK